MFPCLDALLVLPSKGTQLFVQQHLNNTSWKSSAAFPVILIYLQVVPLQLRFTCFPREEKEKALPGILKHLSGSRGNGQGCCFHTEGLVEIATAK